MGRSKKATGQAGMTLVEVVVVIAILAVLAGILFPVFARAREGGAKTTCLSNLHQLGMGVSLYGADYDDHTPGSSPFKLTNGHEIEMGFGWAGKLYDRVKSKEVFRCPSDPTQVNTAVTLPGSSVVSYGMNSNFQSQLSLSQLPTASRTVLLFEVIGNSALVTATDEGKSVVPGKWILRSPAGNGENGTLAEAGSVSPLPGDGRVTLYATGLLDNAWKDGVGDDYKGQPGRHTEGANYLALDGHSVWSSPKAVSAGANAKSSTNPQSKTGCRPYDWVTREAFSCAEGTAFGSHKLTFSGI